MSYNPSEQYPGGDLRTPSGIVFFGKNPSKPMLDSASAFLVDEDNSQLKVPNIVLAATGNIGIPANTGLVKLEPSAVTFATGVVIEGNLTVNGTTVTVNTETVTIDDNILVLNNNATGSATEDAGIEVERGSDNNVKIFWDEDNNYWSILDDDAVEYELATRSGVQTFINKTIDLDGYGNTILNIPNSSLDYSTIGVNAGNGLTGGGSPALGSSTTLNVGAGSGLQVRADHVDINIPGQTALTGVIDSANDYLMIYDYSANNLKKVNRNVFVSGLGTMTSFTVAGDTGTDQIISESNTLSLIGGTGITVIGSDTDDMTFNVNSGVIASQTGVNDFLDLTESDLLLYFDVSAQILRKISLSTFADSLSHIDGGPVMSGFLVGDGTSTFVVNNGDTIFLNQNSATDIDNTIDTNTNTLTYELKTTSVSAGTYGSTSGVASFTVDSKGRLTGASGINIDHDALTNFVANEHINHTGVSINPGNGLTGGGNIAASRTLTAVGGSGIHVNSNGINASVDNSTIGITNDYLYVKNTGITSTQLASNAVTTAKIADDNVTYAKIQNVVTANRVLGSTTAGGIVSEVQVATAMVADDAITYVKMQNAASSGILLGNIGPVGNTITELSASQVRTLLNVADGAQPGTVTSVGTAGSVNGITLTGGTITTAGTITLGGTLGNIANSQLTNSTVSYGGVTVALGGSDATPAFNLVDATGYKSRNVVTTILETSTSVSATGDQDVYLCTGGSGGLTVTLPAISSNNGRKITIKKIDNGAGQIVIDGNGSETVDGALSKRLYYENESMTLVCHTGATPGWYII